MIMRSLVQGSADIMIRDINSQSPLDLATAKGKNALWKLLEYAEINQVTEGTPRYREFIPPRK
jgi:hypothetical protein